MSRRQTGRRSATAEPQTGRKFAAEPQTGRKFAAEPQTGRKATAPGKVMLAGEYAVLEGADAVLVAVDRRVRARVAAAEPSTQSPFLAAVAEEIAAYAGSDSLAAQTARRIIVDSRALAADSGVKLGLGSSAAATVAAAACALGADSTEPQAGSAASSASSSAASSPVSALIHRIAHRAHGRAQEAQGARGSGADIAVCVHGGVVAVRRPASVHEPVLARPLGARLGAELVFLWTGSAAHTPSLVARVQALAERDRHAYNRALAHVADAAQALIAALRPSAPASEAVAAMEAGAQATAALGRAAGVELETEAHRAISALARAHGGAAKPTGAGAGDIAVAVFADVSSAQAFRSAASAQGLSVLDLSVSPAGVRLE